MLVDSLQPAPYSTRGFAPPAPTDYALELGPNLPSTAPAPNLGRQGDRRAV